MQKKVFIVSINEVMLQYDGKQKKWMVFNFNRKPMSARSKILNLPLLVTLYKIWIETGEYKAVRMG